MSSVVSREATCPGSGQLPSHLIHGLLGRLTFTIVPTSVVQRTGNLNGMPHLRSGKLGSS